MLRPNITSLPGRWGIDEIGGETLAIGGTLRRMELGVWQFLAKGPTCKAQECYPVMVLTRSLDRIPIKNSWLEFRLMFRIHLALAINSFKHTGPIAAAVGPSKCVTSGIRLCGPRPNFENTEDIKRSRMKERERAKQLVKTLNVK